MFSNKIFRATLWSIASNGLTQVMSFITFMILSRLLSVDDFGKVAAVYIFTEIASHISGFGFADALVQKYKYNDKQFWSACWFILFISALVAGILFVGAQVWHAFLPFDDKTESIPLLLGYASLILLFSPLSNCFEARYRKTLNIRVITINKSASSLLGATTGIFLALSGFGAWSLIGQKIITEFLRLTFYLLREIHTIQFELSRSFLMELAYYGVPLVGKKVIQELRLKGAHVILGVFYDTFLLGIYSTGGKFLTLINQVMASIGGQVLFPMFTEQQFNRSNLGDALLKLVNLALFISIILFSSLSFFADSLICLLFGEKWQASGKIFAILSLAGISSFQVKVFNSYLNAIGLTKSQLKVSLIGLLANILLLYLFLPYGINKIAFSQLLLSFLIFAITLHYVVASYDKVFKPLKALYFKHFYASFALLLVLVVNLNEGILKASLNLEIFFSLGVSLYVIILLIVDPYFTKLLKSLHKGFFA